MGASQRGWPAAGAGRSDDVQYLPYFITGGTLLVALLGAVVTGEWWIVAFVPVVGIPYLLLDRKLKHDESPEERVAAEPPSG